MKEGTHNERHDIRQICHSKYPGATSEATVEPEIGSSKRILTRNTKSLRKRDILSIVR